MKIEIDVPDGVSGDQMNDYLELMDKLQLHVEHVKPKIVCLCGSTRFPETFVEENDRETRQGNIVLSVGVLLHSSNRHVRDEEKQKLDQLHFRKIDLADEILVLNVDGYIGESTANEIAYAYCRQKTIRYLCPALNFSNPNHWAAKIASTSREEKKPKRKKGGVDEVS